MTDWRKGIPIRRGPTGQRCRTLTERLVSFAFRYKEIKVFSKLALDGAEVVHEGVTLPSEPIDIRTERLDDHRPEGWLPDFVKIDVEGAESLVLGRCARRRLEKRGVVAVEHVWHEQQSGGLYSLLSGELRPYVHLTWTEGDL